VGESAGSDTGLGVGGERGAAGLRRYSHEAMATIFEVHCAHQDGAYAAQAAHAVFDLVDRLERELSRFLPNSDVGRINALDAGGWTQVAPTTLECLVIARHMFDVTGGRFDVSLGSGLPSLELELDACAVRATASGVRVDLGGIGKGYAVDLAADVLADWGVTQALVHGGFSSVLALDAPAGRDGWPLTLSDPIRPSRVLASLSGRDMALGASGMRKTGHIVDPGTGEAARGRLATWVAIRRTRADERTSDGTSGLRVCAIADALTTAFMLMASEDITALCASTPGLEAWLLVAPDEAEPGDAGFVHVGGV
jgi:FAD:protein FMN transferase